MNEFLFFIHIFVLLGFLAIALYFGRVALTIMIVLQAVFSNLFVIKQIELFGFSVTCSDVFSVGSILGLNLLQEHFGRDAAKQAISLCFLSLVFFFVMSQFHLGYIPTTGDHTQPAFLTIFSSTLRIIVASIVSYFVTQKFDVLFYGWLRERWLQKQFLIRVVLSLSLTQFLDTLLFSYLGLFGIVESIADIIFLSFLVKWVVILLSSPVALLSKKIMVKAHGA